MANIFLTMPEIAFINVLENSSFQDLRGLDQVLSNILNANPPADVRANIIRRRQLIDTFIRRYRREPSPPPRAPKRKDDEDDDQPPDQKQIYMAAKKARGTFNIPAFPPADAPISGYGIGNRWVQHVKAYASKHGMKYNEALKDPKCKSSYKK